MKPILEPHLNARKPDAPDDKVKPTPRPEHSLGTLKMRVPAPAGQPPATAQTPEIAQTAPTPPPAVQAPILKRPSPEPVHLTLAISPSGLPYPLRKPTTPTERTLFETVISAVTSTPDPKPTPAEPEAPIIAAPAPVTAPVPVIAPPVPESESKPEPESQPEIAATLPDAEAADDDPDEIEIVAPSAPPKPVIDLEAQRSQLRVSRFNEDNQRMAGSVGSTGFSIGSRNSLPDGMSDIRIRPLSEAQGQSPIIIPGLQKAAIARAPDIPRSVDQTRPDEVILFFEEDSNRLETGQMAIIHTDVIDLLRRRPELKVDIIGYAEEGVDTETLSKSRALMLRDYLIRNKIEERRIKVTGRANKTKIEPRDRADIFFIR